MARVQALLEALGSALCTKGHKALAGDLRFGDVLTDVAKAALDQAHRELPEPDLRAGLAELAAVSPEHYAERIQRLVAGLETVHHLPDRDRLAGYLSVWPATVRAVLRRPSDPTGKTAPDALHFQKSDDFLLFLPPRLPAYRSGAKPPHMDDWELAQFRGMGECSEVWVGTSGGKPENSPAALKFATDAPTAEAVVRGQGLFREVFELNGTPGIVPLRNVYLDADPPCLDVGYVYGYDLTALMYDWRWKFDVPKPDAALKLMRRLAEVVGKAHAKGVVHRDLKPSNVLLHPTDGGKFTLWVSDWGWGQVQAARAMELGRGITPRGEQHRLALRGSHTPLYACPQMAKRHAPDPRDDVHALGVIWFQLLKRDPHAGAPVGTEWAEEFRPFGFTDAQARLLAACIAVRPERRPADAVALADMLANVAAAVSANPAHPDGTHVIRLKGGSGEYAAAGAGPGSGRYAPPSAGPGSGVGLTNHPTVKLGKSLGMKREAEDAGQLELSGRDERTVGVRDAGAGYGGLPKMVTNSLGMTFALIAPGAFRMGSPEAEPGHREHEGPAHPVTLTKPFYLSVYPVTQGVYERLVGKNPAHFTKSHGGGPEHPVESVTWHDAAAFCEKLGQAADEVLHGRAYRLPTEAEWEYACRAGSPAAYWCGDKLTAREAHFGHTGKGAKTAPAGGHPANPWALYDMHGNVQEWVADWYDEYYYLDAVADDPPGPHYGSLKAVRGGCWSSHATDCRSAARRGLDPDTHADTVGFRVVLAVNPK
ncbi:MAG: SUMF1/EgtB/PvdO family nonheme iron enzyme [Gemmataceae bacterium]